MKKDIPPKFLLRFFQWFCRSDLHIYIEGDLLELYQEHVHLAGRKKANRRFLIDVIKLLRPGIIRPIGATKHVNGMMYNNYLKIGFRSLRKHKGYAAINILGLAIGLAVSIVTARWTSAHSEPIHAAASARSPAPRAPSDPA